MRRRIVLFLLACALAAGPLHAGTVGAPAPDFTLTDIAGKAVKLSDFKGRHVVLEWVNPHCPYVAKHYDSGNMQAVQKDATVRKVVWLSIASTHPGHHEYAGEKDMARWQQEKKAAPAHTMLDKDGKVGRLYGARTTPHMFVIDPKGMVVYAGAIDDKRSTSREDVKTAKNHVRAALDATLAGKPVPNASNPPYG